MDVAAFEPLGLKPRSARRIPRRRRYCSMHAPMESQGAGRVATVSKLDANRWEVHMGSRESSEVTIVVHMSRAMAEQIATRETERLKEFNRDRDDVQPESAGSAVLNVLGLYATTGRI